MAMHAYDSPDKDENKGKKPEAKKSPVAKDDYGEMAVKPVADAVDEVLGEEDLGVPGAETPAAPGAPGAEDEDVQTVATGLDVDPAHAKALLEAAKKLDATKALDAKGLVDAIAKNFKLRMQLEELASRPPMEPMEMPPEALGAPAPPAPPAPPMPPAVPTV